MNDRLSIARIALVTAAALPPRPEGGHVLLVTCALPGADWPVAESLARELASKLDGDVALIDGTTHGAREAGTAAGGLAALMASGVIGTAETPPDTGAARLYRMPAGAATPIDRFFRVHAVANALKALRARFRLSVIQGPPLEECGGLLQQVDKVLMVVDGRAASPRAMRRAMADARVGPADIDGAILVNARCRLPSWWEDR